MGRTKIIPHKLRVSVMSGKMWFYVTPFLFIVYHPPMWVNGNFEAAEFG